MTADTVARAGAADGRRRPRAHTAARPWVWRAALLACVLLATTFASVTSASAKGETNVGGTYEFVASGRSAAEPDREQRAVVGRFSLYQHIGGALGGALGGGVCDTGEFGSLNLAGSASGSSVTFTATANPPLECSLKFTGSLFGETMTGTWSINLGAEDCGEDEPCEGTFEAQRISTYPSEEEEIERKKEEREAKEQEVAPAVDEVIDDSTGLASGSILGNDTLQINGSGFVVPEGWKAELQFYVDGRQVGQSEASVESSTQIEASSPDLDSLASEVAAGQPGLPVDVRVEISGEDEEGDQKSFTSPVSQADVYEALTPTVTGVRDEKTGTSSGPIGGGDTLRVKGAGFIVPEQASAQVDFYLGGEKLEAVPATVISETEAEVTAPNLSKYASRIPAGETGLSVDARLEITSEADAPGEDAVLSPVSAGDLYEAVNSDEPTVSSVTDEGDGTDQGSILGGDTLQIDGTDFDVPDGGKAEVEFEFDGETLGQPVDVTPDSSTEIELPAPDLSSDESDVAAGQHDLPLEVHVLLINEKGEIVTSAPSAGDIFDDDVPVVSSAINEQTGDDGGSILGGENMVVKGSGFEVPAGGKATVSFLDESRTVLKEVVVTPLSATEIDLIAPDLSQFESQAKAGAVATDVVVTISSGSAEASSKPSVGDDEDDLYRAEVPIVDSVTDVETDLHGGSILGGETLDIQGSGFDVPGGTTATVSFLDESKTVLAEVEVTPISTSEIQLSSPDLSKYVSKSEHGALPTDVVVTIASDSSGVSSPVSDEEGAEDAFLAEAPDVNSVLDQQSGSRQGSILGGDTLVIKGAGFEVPEGGKATVSFLDESKTVLKQVAVTPLSGSEIDVTAPDLSKYASEAKSGVLATDVVVTVSSGSAEVSSEPSRPASDEDVFSALVPRISSVTDQDTGSQEGSILGGDTLKVEGSGFEVLGTEATVSFLDAGKQVLGTGVVSSASESQIEVTVPDLSKFASDADEGRLVTDVVVTITAGSSKVSSEPSGPDDEEDVFVALTPVITSVTDEETEKNSGVIGGGEALQVNGDGFLVPEGGKARVSFLDGETEELLNEVAVDPISASEIELSSPDLSADVAKADKDGVLLTDVRVTIDDNEGATVESELSADTQFSFDALTIDSANAATFKVGDEGSFDISAKGPSPVTLKESGDLPDGVTFTDAGEGKGSLTGTPAEGTAGVYKVTITASNGVEPDATQEFTLTVQDVPGAPTDVKAVAGVGAAEVSWTAPSSDGQSPIENYVVKATPGGQSVTVDGSETSAKIEGLTVGVSYMFSVEANNELGAGPTAESANVVPTSTPVVDAQEATSHDPGGEASTAAVPLSGGGTLTATGDGAGTIEAGSYGSDPVTKLAQASTFFDVAKTPDSSFSAVSFEVCGVAAGASVDWWNPIKGSWAAVSNQSPVSGPSACTTVTVNASTTPALSDFYGTIFAVVGQAGCAAAPGIETQPRNTSVALPSTATFTAAATTPAGCGEATVQWYSKAPGAPVFSPISGAASSSYTTAATTKAQNGTEYEAIFTNAFGPTSTSAATLTVLTHPAKLTLSPQTLKQATASSSYHEMFTLGGGTAPYSIHISGAAPPGLAWGTAEEAEGQIELSGEPTSAGTGTFVLEGSDSSHPALSIRREYTLTVQLDLSGSVGKATAGETYSHQLTSSGGSEPYDFSLTAGALPGGVELNDSGLLSGTPAHAGGASFAITVTDSSDPALTRTRQYTLNVELGLAPLPRKGTLGTPYGEHGEGAPLQAVGGTAPYTYELLAPAPPGLTLSDGILAGTPEVEGSYTFKVRATDSSAPALSGEHSYTIKIAKARG